MSRDGELDAVLYAWLGVLTWPYPYAGKLTQYYTPSWRDVEKAVTPLDLAHIRETFSRAVDKRLMVRSLVITPG